jgi:hypothetical protein
MGVKPRRLMKFLFLIVATGVRVPNPQVVNLAVNKFLPFKDILNQKKLRESTRLFASGAYLATISHDYSFSTNFIALS